MSHSYWQRGIKDYAGCDIVATATFYEMGKPDNYKLGGYDVDANTVFQVLDEGVSPQTAFGQIFGAFVGTPKAKANILFELKQGDGRSFFEAHQSAIRRLELLWPPYFTRS